MNPIKEFVYRLRGDFTTEKLVSMGMKVGHNFKRLNGVILDPGHCWLIEIGDNVTLAPRVHILCHDASTKTFLNYTKIGRVTIGDNVFIGAESVVLPGVTIGSNVVISQDAYICTASHDVSSPSMALVTKPVKICDQSWIAAKATVLPGVTIGEGAVVGACAVVAKDVKPWSIAVGNPARVVGSRTLK